MKLRIVWIGKTKEPAIASLTAEYARRLGGYIPTTLDEFDSEEALLKAFARSSAKQISGKRSSQAQSRRPVLVLLDPRGKQLTSEEIAYLLRGHADGGTQELAFAIGPADGWSEAALEAADVRLSFGNITLPHELARVVLAEQLYRGFTILAGHPYHKGH